MSLYLITGDIDLDQLVKVVQWVELCPPQKDMLKFYPQTCDSDLIWR